MNTESAAPSKFSLFELLPTQLLDKIPKPNLSNFIQPNKKVETENQFGNYNNFEINTSPAPIPQSTQLQADVTPINPNLFNTKPIAFGSSLNTPVANTSNQVKSTSPAPASTFFQPNVEQPSSARFYQPSVETTPTTFFQGAPESQPPASEQTPPSFFQPTVQPATVFPQPAVDPAPPPFFKPAEVSENVVPPTFFSPSDIPTISKPLQASTGANPYSNTRLGRGLTAYKNPLLPAANATPVFQPNQIPQAVAGINSTLNPIAQAQVFGIPPPFNQHQASVPVSTPTVDLFTSTGNNPNGFFAPPPSAVSTQQEFVQSASYFSEPPKASSPAVTSVVSTPLDPNPFANQTDSAWQNSSNSVNIFAKPSEAFITAVQPSTIQYTDTTESIPLLTAQFVEPSKSVTPPFTPLIRTSVDQVVPEIVQPPANPVSAKNLGSGTSSLKEEPIYSNPPKSVSPLTSYFQPDASTDFFTNSIQNSENSVSQFDSFFTPGQNIQTFETVQDSSVIQNIPSLNNIVEEPKHQEISEPEIVPQINLFSLKSPELKERDLDSRNFFDLAANTNFKQPSVEQAQSDSNYFNYFNQQSIEDNQSVDAVNDSYERQITATLSEADEDFSNMASGQKIKEMNSPVGDSSVSNIVYRPVYRHWFYKKSLDTKVIWTPFTMTDSMALEDALDNPDTIILATDGGRFDVDIRARQRTPVYWTGEANEVRRCSWFYKGVDSRYVPYEEDVAALLEEEYRQASNTGVWNRRIELPNGEKVVFHGSSVMVHFLVTQNPDTWGSNVPQTTNRPRVVKRGVDEFNIDDGEPEKVDHLLFMVHGIGKFCDLKFRPVEEVGKWTFTISVL